MISYNSIFLSIFIYELTVSVPTTDTGTYVYIMFQRHLTRKHDCMKVKPKFVLDESETSIPVSSHSAAMTSDVKENTKEHSFTCSVEDIDGSGEINKEFAAAQEDGEDLMQLLR
jgi:hypothetical protein